MADYTLTPDDQGAYEIPLTANDEKTVTLDMAGKPGAMAVHHSGDSPIYIGIDRTAVITGSGMRMLMPGGWLELALGSFTSRTVHLISAADAVVSITRT